MHIGLIGGIGPAATLVYYEAIARICAGARQRLNLTMVHADSAEMIANLRAGRANAQAETFARYVDQLQAGGCKAAAITSMGGHFCVKELRNIASLPIISAVPVMNARFAEANYRCVGVLGTRAVMESGIYGVSSARLIIPEATELAEVEEQYFAMAASARATPEQARFFHAAGRRLIDRGAEVVLLAGTDLSLAFASQPGYPVLDSALLHAEALAKVAMDEIAPAAFA